MLVAIITFIGFTAAVFLAVREVRSAKTSQTPIPRSAIAWGVVLLALQLFIGVYAAIGLITPDALSAIVLNVVLIGGVWMSFGRAHTAANLLALMGPEGRFHHPLAGGVVLILLAGVFAVLGLEIPSNHDLTWMYPLCLLLEWGLVTVVLMALYFLAQRRGVAPAVLVAALCILGIAEYFVITFKSMPIQPGDLSALSTAAAVSAGYHYELNAFCLYGIALAVVGMMLCQLAGIVRPQRVKGDPSNRGRLVVNLVVGLVLVAGVTAHVTLIDYYNQLWVQVYTWRPLESYYREGFLPCFISAAQTIKPPKPKGYDIDEAKSLIKKYAKEYDEDEGATASRQAAEAQFEQEKPTVITIMNETFSDLSIYENLHSDYQGPTFFKSMSDTLQRGRLYVSAYGGGTANTEFEYITGNSMAFLGSGVYPYTIYDMQNKENLAAQFKELGYTTTAMHPNHGTNWNRENVYQDFGFDNFLTISDFQDAEKLRGMVTDKATYDKILDLLNSNSDPQFIFDVTMQNHSGYDTGLIPADELMSLNIDGEVDPEVNEYVSLIQQSDQALRYFIDKLSRMDRKVVLVFFGDHQPFFPNTFNDKWFTGEDSATHAERLWQTDYIIWANYDVAGNEQVSTNDDLSTNYLSATLMNLIGAPLTDYQKAHISLRQALPAINSTGYEDGSLAWYLSSAAASEDGEGTTAGIAAAAARADLAKMQYYMLFRDGKDPYTKHFQSAANETDPNLAPGTTQIK